MERKFVNVPFEQVEYIKTNCSIDFRFNEQAHDMWLWLMKLACGDDFRYLPNDKDYDFDSDFHLFRTASKEKEKLFGYMQDSLNVLLYEVTQREYYELAVNISNIMSSMEEIGSYEIQESDYWG